MSERRTSSSGDDSPSAIGRSETGDLQARSDSGSFDRAEAIGAYLLLAMVPGIYVLVAGWLALLAIGLSSVFAVDPLVLVVTVLTGVVLYAKRPPESMYVDSWNIRILVGVLISVLWVAFVVAMGSLLGVTVAFAGVTALAFTLVLALFILAERRIRQEDERRHAAVVAANRDVIVRKWAREAEQIPELRDMLREAGWQPESPGAWESYLRVWDEYRARRRALGLPAWPQAADKSRD